MRRFTATVLLVALAVLPSVGTSEVPVRVVSLDLCTDWMLSHFAGRDRVKALSPLVKQYPVSWIADDWPVHDGSLEQILELEPELILTGQYNAMMLRRRLRELGLRVEILPLPQNLRDIDNYQQKFLQLLGMPVTGSKRSQAEIDNSKAARLLLLGANGIATGRNTFENDVIEQAGWQNYLKEDGYIRLDLEQVISDPPDAVLWSAPGHAALANRFAEHPVLKKLIADDRWLQTDYWRWQCPGPWTWQLVEQLRTWQTH